MVFNSLSKKGIKKRKNIEDYSLETVKLIHVHVFVFCSLCNHSEEGVTIVPRRRSLAVQYQVLGFGYCMVMLH